MNLCWKHKVPEDEFGDCPYCLSGENPSGMDEIRERVDFYRQDLCHGEISHCDPELIFTDSEKLK